MPLDPLSNHYSMTNPASVYDEEAMTALELAGRTANKVNECVQAFNLHEAAVDQDVTSFKQAVTSENITFKHDVNENVENFKDSVNQEIHNINSVIVDKLGVRTVYDYTTGAGKHPDTPPVYVDGGRIYVTPGVYYTASGAYTLTFDTNMLIPTADTAQTLYLLLRPDDKNRDIVQLRSLDDLEANDMVICSAYVLTSGATTLSNDSLFSRYYTRSVEQQLPQYRKKIEDAVPGYVVSGAISIDTQNRTIAVAEKLTVTAPTGKNGYRTVPVNTSAPRPYTLPSGYIGTFRISVTDDGNYLDYGIYQADGNETIYLGAFAYGKLCGCHFAPDVVISVDGVDHLAGDLSDSREYHPESLRIVLPAKIATMCNSEMELPHKNFSVDRDVEIATNNPVLGAFNNTTIIHDIDEDESADGVFVLYKNGIEQDRKESCVSFWGNSHIPDDTVNVLLIGDSIIDNDNTMDKINLLFNGRYNANVNFVGSQTAINGLRHEAHSGWSFGKFLDMDSVDGERNPLRMDGEVSPASISEYLWEIGVNKLDYVFICLGVNDVKWGAIFDQSDISAIIARAKLFSDAILNGVNIATGSYPKIFFTLIPTGSTKITRIDIAPSAMHKKINSLNLAFIETFDNGAYNENITTVPVGLSFTDDCYHDAIHPSGKGAEKIANFYLAKILASGGGEF